MDFKNSKTANFVATLKELSFDEFDITGVIVPQEVLDEGFYMISPANKNVLVEIGVGG